MALQKITYLSLFPEVIDQGLSHSLVGKARESKKIELNFIQIRDFSKDKHKSVDDTPFGGSAGMLLKADVMFEAWKSVVGEERTSLNPAGWVKDARTTQDLSAPINPVFHDRPYTILLSPQGKLLTQERAKTFATSYSHLVLVCGHYEGVDERFIETCVDEELSVGDYVLTGGEFAALVASDVIIRLIPEVVGNADSISGDSLEDGLLKAPQYTRPRDFQGKGVPEVLLSGNHAKIAEWQKAQSLERTKLKRPDLWEKLQKS